jgi:hypothetical protein
MTPYNETRSSTVQKVSPRKVKAPVIYTQENEDILHFPLNGLLSAGHTLALNTTLGTLSQLVCENDMPRLLGQQQFTTSEIYVLMPVLEAHPYYCAYETLLASYSHGKVTDVTVARCRELLEEAQEEGIWDQEMRPVRNILSRARIKLHNFGIDIISVHETGYMLKRMATRRYIEVDENSTVTMR